MSTLNALEIAIYALVLTGSNQPFTCTYQEGVKQDAIVCSNGRSAVLDKDGNIEFDTGTAVLKQPDGKLIFSNGITTFWGSTGWVHFSNGLSARRLREGYRISNGLLCAPRGARKAECKPDKE